MPRILLLFLCAGIASAADVELLWDANSEGDLSHYQIHRSGSAGFTPSDATLLVAEHLPSGVAQENFVDTNLSAGQSYWYRIIAVDTSGNTSVPSEDADILIALPLNFTAQTKSHEEIMLHWQTTPGVDFQLLSRQPSTQTNRIMTILLPTDAETYRDRGLDPTHTYSYQLHIGLND